MMRLHAAVDVNVTVRKNALTAVVQNSRNVNETVRLRACAQYTIL